MEVCRATIEDLEDLDSLFEKIEREANAGRLEAPTAASQGLHDALARFDVFRSDSAWIFCARVDGAFVGYALAVRIPKLDPRLGFLFIDELHVLQPHRRCGVATALVSAVLELASRLGYHGVRLLARPENAAARALYANLGFDIQPANLCERPV